MITKSDNELAEEVNRGNLSSFTLLMERYQGKVFGMILQMTDDRELAKDLTQEVFLRAYTRMSSFNPKYRFFSWLYRIALNACLNSLASRKHFESLDKAINLAATEEPQGTSWREKILKQAILELRKQHRSFILLKYYFGLSCQEISEATGVSEKRVKDGLFNARRALREKLIRKSYFSHD